MQSLGVVIIVQLAKSEEFKAQANKLFQDNHVKEAMELYILALDLNPSNHILFANRAFCHIKLENYGWFPHFRPHFCRLPGTQPISARLCVGRSRIEYHVTSIQTIVIAYLKRLQEDEHLRMHAKHAPCIQA